MCCLTSNYTETGELQLCNVIQKEALLGKVAGYHDSILLSPCEVTVTGLGSGRAKWLIICK